MADKALFKVDLLLINELLEGSDLANLLKDVCFFFVVTINSETLIPKSVAQL